MWHVPLDGGHDGRRGAGRLLVDREQGARQRSPAAPAGASRAAPAAQPGPPPGDEQGPGQGGVGQRHPKLSSGAPPTAAHGAAGVPAWLIASLPHGNAYGHRLRSAPAHTHQPATASGQARRSSSNRWPTASSAKITASATASASHAYHATLSSQDSSGTKKASPNTRPASSEARRPRRHSATASSAGPAGASGQIPIGGKAAVRASPPVSATASAQGRPRRAAAAGRVARAGRAGWWTGTAVSAGLRGGRVPSSRGPGPRPLAGSCYRLGTGRGEGAGLVLRAGWHARALTARAAGHRHRSSRLAAGPCLWAHTAACEGNRATGLPPPPSRLARNSRRRRRIARRGNAAGRPLADLRRPGPLVAPWCPSLVLSERSPR